MVISRDGQGADGVSGKLHLAAGILSILQGTCLLSRWNAGAFTFFSILFNAEVLGQRKLFWQYIDVSFA